MLKIWDDEIKNRINKISSVNHISHKWLTDIKCETMPLIYYVAQDTFLSLMRLVIKTSHCIIKTSLIRLLESSLQNTATSFETRYKNNLLFVNNLCFRTLIMYIAFFCVLVLTNIHTLRSKLYLIFQRFQKLDNHI